MREYVLGFVTAGAALALGGYFFIMLGGMPVATQSPLLPFEETIAKKVIEVHLKGSETIAPAVSASDVNLTEGAKVYANHCAQCHGSRGGDTPLIAKGMFPKPPQLLKEGQGEVGYPPGSVYRLIEGGIRLTGMPGFSGLLSENEIWQVTQMLVNADKLPARAVDALASE